MEINPYESRLRMLQQIDGVQMQREASPDEETAGCPGCPYFWTCPVPHRGEEVKAPVDIEFADVEDVLGPRAAYAPRDESDVGWTDDWVDEEGLRVEQPGSPELPVSSDLSGSPAAPDLPELPDTPVRRAGLDDPDTLSEPTDREDDEGREDHEDGTDDEDGVEHGDVKKIPAPGERGRRRASRWSLFRRR